MTTSATKAIVTTKYGDVCRMSLPSPAWEGSTPYGTGVTLEAVYISPRYARCVIETYSIWESNRGGHVGKRHFLIEDSAELLQLADMDDELMTAMESAGLITHEQL